MSIKTFIYVSILASIYFNSAFAKPPNELYKLTISIQKLKNTTTPIQIELLKVHNDVENKWEFTELIQGQYIYLEKNQLITFDNIKKGNYAVRAFQDNNENNTFDKTSLSIPKEPVAFSLNPSLFKGEPSPKRVLFLIDSNKSITLNFKHPKKRKTLKGGKIRS